VGERMTAIFVGKTLLEQFLRLTGAFAVADASASVRKTRGASQSTTSLLSRSAVP